MTESNKPKVPALNLKGPSLLGSVTTPQQSLTTDLSQTSTQAESQVQPNHSFYTSRVATDEYKIRGMQDDTPSQNPSLTKEQLVAQSDENKKKRKKRNKKKHQKTKPEDSTQQTTLPSATGVQALKDNLPADQLFADSDQSEDEGIADYKIGGYHSVHIGEILINRYVILQKLGWGHFSTVWLARDTAFDTYVALKVQKSASHYQEAAYDEVEILDQVSKNAFNQEWVADVMRYKATSQYSVEDCHTVQLLNSFIHTGANGSHFIMVFEILGVNLLEIMKRYDYKGIPVPIVRRMAKQILIGLDYLHRFCKIIHTDLKPENVIVSLNKKELTEIMERGQISSMNRKVKTLDVEKLFNPSLTKPQVKPGAAGGVLNGVDTEGMTKQQKKKLKKKVKKQQNIVSKDSLFQDKEQQPKFDDFHADQNKLNQNGAQNLVGNDTDEPEKPRSQSLPNQTSRAHDQEEGDDDISNAEWQFVFERDFPGEIQSYFKSKQEYINQQQQQREKLEENMHKRGPLATENIQLKICDLGNGCWTHHHFTHKIQTRQYRGPEVMLGIDYDVSADLWSFACMIFELITGDFLFDPRKSKDETYGKTDDHLAQMIELLGPMPKNYALSATHFEKFFRLDPLTGNYTFAKIKGLRHFPLEQLLIDKYRFKAQEAHQLADFLLKVLKWFPSERASARQMLSHPWLQMPDDYSPKMTELEYQKHQLKNQHVETNFHQVDICFLTQEDWEFNGADDEADNLTLDSASNSSISLSGIDTNGEVEKEFNLNCSFTGGYLPNTDISRVDKGLGNPQFTGIVVKS